MRTTRRECVTHSMSATRLCLFLAISLAACTADPIGPPGAGGNFAAFGQDENTCRTAGTAAINAPPPPAQAGAQPVTPAQKYDYAYQTCMISQILARQRGAYANNAPQGPAPYPRPYRPNAEFPDAFYSIPYATPGYGYDGFSY